MQVGIEKTYQRKELLRVSTFMFFNINKCRRLKH